MAFIELLRGSQNFKMIIELTNKERDFIIKDIRAVFSSSTFPVIVTLERACTVPFNRNQWNENISKKEFNVMQVLLKKLTEKKP